MATQTRGSPQANSSRIGYILDVTTNTPGFPAHIAAISALSLNEVLPGDSEVGTTVCVQIERMRERVGVPETSVGSTIASPAMSSAHP